MKHISFSLCVSVIATLFFSTGCKKDNNANPSVPPYDIPATYNFDNADSLQAKTILSMLAEMELEINRGNTTGNIVDAGKLKSMFSNEGGYFTDTVFSNSPLNLNTSGIRLKALTSNTAQALLENIMDSIELASRSDLPATNGVAGVSSRQSLLSANGVFWRQYFTKTVMGVLIGHQITDVYLADSLNSNISIEAKQHAWDQAFYLWGVPADFPTNRAKVKYWGSYTSQIDSGIAKPVNQLTGINSNTTLLNAFLKGRAALANNDLATAQEQAGIIIPFFEIMEASAALHELNEAKENLVNSAAAVCGNLSESLGFWTALQFNNHKKISDADFQAVLSLYGTDIWNIRPADIDTILDKISSIYGWDAIKSNL